jgi:O-acetyl-ADP-ribose deacetylase (regulator of RNase III)
VWMGAIHRAAGSELLKKCKKIRNEVLNGIYLPTGKADITKGYNLSAKYVLTLVIKRIFAPTIGF